MGGVSQGLLQGGVVGGVCGSRKINYLSVNKPLPVQSFLKDFGSIRSHLKAPLSVHHKCLLRKKMFYMSFEREECNTVEMVWNGI